MKVGPDTFQTNTLADSLALRHCGQLVYKQWQGAARHMRCHAKWLDGGNSEPFGWYN